MEEKFLSKLRALFSSQKMAFVAYRKAGETKVSLRMQSNTETYSVENFEENGYVFAPFRANETRYLIPTEFSEVSEYEFKAISAKNDLEVTMEIGEYTKDLDQKNYEMLVQKAIDQIENKEFEKVVLSRKEKVALADPDPVLIFKKLLQKYEHAYVYCWFHPETGIWMGATPESLIKTERNRFKTMALAGTQLNKNTGDFEWGKKEIEEQLLVTNFILSQLESIAEIENIQAGKAYSRHAGNLLHICTEITGSFKSTKVLKNILEALHPTPAICGLPREKALDFLIENEAYEREFYTGFHGELNVKTEIKRNSNRKNQENRQFSSIVPQTDLYVNLRCMKIKGGNAHVYVGGGITKDSNPTSEWMETLNKADTMKSILVK